MHRLSKIFLYWLVLVLCTSFCYVAAATSEPALTVQLATGYVDDGYEAPLVETSPVLYSNRDNLPSSFDLRNVNGKNYVTPVRDQNPYGTCWAFGAIGSIESNLLMRGYTQYTDLSELHLVNYANHRPLSLTNQDSGLQGDYVKNYVTSMYQNENALMRGGNYYDVNNTLSSWYGATHESILPYYNPPYINSPLIPHVASIVDGTLDDSFAHSYNVLQFDHSYAISIDQPNEVKKMLMSHGAGAIECFAGTNTSPYIYQDYTNVANHCVTLIGWDDNIPKESFISPLYDDSNFPPIDGAWLCKNSWGTSYHDEGYFWLSYADPSISNIFFYSMTPIEDGYDIIHQYDGGNSNDKINATTYMIDNNLDFYEYIEEFKTIAFANVFVSKQDESLEAVYISNLHNSNSTITINVYTSLSKNSLPDEGLLQSASTTQVYYPYAGSYTIPLKEPVQLASGERFSIVITLSCNEYFPDIDVDHTYTNEVDNKLWFESQNTTKPGESFWKPLDGSDGVHPLAQKSDPVFHGEESGWKDLSVRGETVRLKALCKRKEINSPSEDTPIPPDDTSIVPPKAGDTSMPELWMGTFGIAVFIGIYLITSYTISKQRCKKA